MENKNKQLNIDVNNENIIGKLIDVQNQINAISDLKIIGVFSADSQDLSFDFSFANAKVFEIKGDSTLIIDANYYDSSSTDRLSLILDKEMNFEKNKTVKISSNISFIRPNDCEYPSDFFKNGCLEKVIKSHQKSYKHFIVLLPDPIKNMEVLYAKSLIQTNLLVVKKNKTLKSDIFRIIKFLNENDFKLTKTIII